MLPPQVTKVPALYQIETKQVLFGDDIYGFLLPQEVAINQVATGGNGEPECYSIYGMNKMSDTFSFLDQSPEDLSSKGGGGVRQLRRFATLEDQSSIHCPTEDYVADKVGKQGKSLEEYKAERDSLVKPITRI
jgi:hypothetical protein